MTGDGDLDAGCCCWRSAIRLRSSGFVLRFSGSGMSSITTSMISSEEEKGDLILERRSQRIGFKFSAGLGGSPSRKRCRDSQSFDCYSFPTRTKEIIGGQFGWQRGLFTESRKNIETHL